MGAARQWILDEFKSYSNDIIGSEVSGNGFIDNRRVLVFSEDPNDSPSRQIARFIKKVTERYYSGMTVDHESPISAYWTQPRASYP